MARDYLNEPIDWEEITWPDLLNLFRVLPRSRETLINIVQARWLGERDIEIERLGIEEDTPGDATPIPIDEAGLAMESPFMSSENKVGESAPVDAS